jgi:hypothetical protein
MIIFHDERRDILPLAELRGSTAVQAEAGFRAGGRDCAESAISRSITDKQLIV